MNGIIFTNYTCLVFTILIAFCFFCKKKIDSIETKLYGRLIIVSLFELVFGLVSSYLIFYDASMFIISIVGRIYLMMILSWIYILTLYVVNIRRQDHVIISTKTMTGIINFIYAVSLVLMVVLNIDFIIDNGNIFCQGMGLNVLYISALIMIVIFLIIGIQNVKYNDKRFIPLWIFILVGCVFTLLQYFLPELFLIVPLEAFVASIMYHTIENPDVKMVQELSLAREQAERANRAKTDFLSSMSHEIRTPLNAIVGFSDCIADAKNLGEAQENAKDIVNASQTLLEIVNGILDISKIEAGKIEIINTKYNALETFEDLAKLIAPRMKEKGLDFSYKIASDLPETLFGDHANIKKIVTNLLSNACKYTDTGYVHYEVNCINTKDVSKLIISVEDSGRGIRKESVDKMFTKFQRLDEDRNTTIEGTGLGLAITKQLIELMGGRIIVHTVYGQGSKFTVVLNQKITQADVTVKKFKSTLDLNNIRVLIVDDTPLNLKVGCKLLEKYGANHVATCTSGFECLDRINRGEVYDVILLDDMMPKMSGVETLKKLKENPNFKIPTVALTANAITGMKEKYLSDGFDDYLAKPIDQTQLIQVFNQILGRSATEDINVSEVQRQFNNENIRNDEIPNVIAQEKAERERDENNHSIIPVEDNIEELLGNQLDMNYKEELLKPIVVDHIEDIEILDDNSETSQSSEQTQIVSPVPLVHNAINLYDKEYLESNGVDVDHALELLGDMNMYNMTISDFISGVEDKWNKIVEYKNSNNMTDYAIVVHSLKSDCKYLGFMKLADIAYQHELKSKENDIEFINNNFDVLETEYKKILEVAKTYTEHNVVEG